MRWILLEYRIKNSLKRKAAESFGVCPPFFLSDGAGALTDALFHFFHVSYLALMTFECGNFLGDGRGDIDVVVGLFGTVKPDFLYLVR